MSCDVPLAPVPFPSFQVETSGRNSKIIVYLPFPAVKSMASVGVKVLVPTRQSSPASTSTAQEADSVSGPPKPVSTLANPRTQVSGFVKESSLVVLTDRGIQAGDSDDDDEIDATPLGVLAKRTPPPSKRLKISHEEADLNANSNKLVLPRESSLISSNGIPTMSKQSLVQPHSKGNLGIIGKPVKPVQDVKGKSIVQYPPPRPRGKAASSVSLVPGLEYVQVHTTENKKPVVTQSSRQSPARRTKKDIAANRPLGTGHAVVLHNLPDYVEGDKLKSMVSWLRGMAVGLDHNFDLAYNYSYAHKYRAEFSRTRDALRVMIPPADDPLVNPTASVASTHRAAASSSRRQGRAAAAGRRSERTRVVPDFYVPSLSPTHGKNATTLFAGPAYQAALPSRRPRPPAPLPHELLKLGTPIYKPDDQPECSFTPPLVQDVMEPTYAYEQRHHLMDDIIRHWDNAWGAQGKALGTADMGAKVRKSWTPEEEKLFAAGFEKYGRAFREVRKACLPGKTVEDIVAYYYNVWKLLYTHDSRVWHLCTRHADD